MKVYLILGGNDWDGADVIDVKLYERNALDEAWRLACVDFGDQEWRADGTYCDSKSGYYYSVEEQDVTDA